MDMQDIVLEEEPRTKAKLRFWMNRGELRKIAKVLDKMHSVVYQQFRRLPSDADARSCPSGILRLLAWQRDVERLSGEKDALFRRRVHVAFENAKDAGSRIGFDRIWERLELGRLIQRERFDEENWDVIHLKIDEKIFAYLPEDELDMLIWKYGRTCRRYRLETIAYADDQSAMCFDVSGEYNYATAIYQE